MKIALLGYGKMGKTIEKIAMDRGHEIILKVDEKTPISHLEQADVAIDFSTPETAVKHITAGFEAQIPVICGTTGWLDRFDEVEKLCTQLDGTFLYASNFSLGVNLFFELNRSLAQLMYKIDGYTVDIEEIHHTQKLDAPSGTAISLAKDIVKNSFYSGWSLTPEDPLDIPIKALREDEVPGTHEVNYRSAIDTLSIKHTAHSREGFALGAVIAAEWIKGKKGTYTMKDVLNIH